jgi:hypothetical protein
MTISPSFVVFGSTILFGILTRATRHDAGGLGDTCAPGCMFFIVARRFVAVFFATPAPFRSEMSGEQDDESAIFFLVET